MRLDLPSSPIWVETVGIKTRREGIETNRENELLKTVTVGIKTRREGIETSRSGPGLLCRVVGIKTRREGIETTSPMMTK